MDFCYIWAVVITTSYQSSLFKKTKKTIQEFITSIMASYVAAAGVALCLALLLGNVIFGEFHEERQVRIALGTIFSIMV